MTKKPTQTRPRDVAAQAHKALELRAHGLSIPEIAEDLGLSTQVVRNRLEKGYSDLPRLSTEELQGEVELALRATLKEVGRILFDPASDSSEKLRASAEARAVLRDLTKLLGLAEPPAITEALLRRELGLED